MVVDIFIIFSIFTLSDSHKGDGHTSLEFGHRYGKTKFDLFRGSSFCVIINVNVQSDCHIVLY